MTESNNIQRLREISGHLIDPEIAVRIFEATPDAMIVVDRNGTIQLVNRQTEILFGYSRAELYDQPLGMLLLESARGRHDLHLSEYFSDPRIRPMGLGLDLRGLHKSGAQFGVEVNLSPIVMMRSTLALAVVRRLRDEDGG